MWERVGLELETAKQPIGAKHVDDVTVWIGAHGFEQPLGLQLCVILGRADLADTVAYYFLQRYQVIGHPFLIDGGLVACLVSEGLDVDVDSWNACLSTVRVIGGCC